jgi:hypothetical protein
MAQVTLQYSIPANGGGTTPAISVDAVLTLNDTRNGDGSYTVLGITGTRTSNGSTINITGLAPVGADGADQKFWTDPSLNTRTQSYVTSGGITYTTDGTPNAAAAYAANAVNLNYNAIFHPLGYGEDVRGSQAASTFTGSFQAPPAPPAPCYVTGTRIRILRRLTIQDVLVEHLRVGDVALTASGKPRPIRWIGSRSYPSLTAPQADRPVRIKAGALVDNVPARDLLVSPDHALMVDGLFVAAGHLVNGTSITRGEMVRDLTYWHVELDIHDMLVAEGAAAESFLAAPGVRGQFDGVGSDEAPVAAPPYAERVESGPELDALRERLILRAGLSIEPTRFGAVRAWMDRCDGTRVAGWAQDAAHPNAPMCLDIVVDGAVVAMTLAEQYRADIAAAGVGDGRHGFDLDLDEPLAPGKAHTVEVRRSADGLQVCAMAVDAAGTWTPLLAA